MPSLFNEKSGVQRWVIQQKEEDRNMVSILFEYYVDKVIHQILHYIKLTKLPSSFYDGSESLQTFVDKIIKANIQFFVLNIAPSL